jgi:hypothetical protein
MRRILFAWVVLAVLLAACADASAPGGGGSGSEPPPTTESSPRLDAYESLIRYLADPKGPQPIYISSKLCAELMKSDVICPDNLSQEEQQELGLRLQDIGDVVFVANDDPGPPPDEMFQRILLGPIVEKPDGLRVEGGTICGGLCGTGSVYVLVATDDGYEVTGIDDSYGTWIS